MNEENGNVTQITGTREELERLKTEIRARRLLSENDLPEEALDVIGTDDPERLEEKVASLKQLISREAARLCEKRLAGMQPSPLAAAADPDTLSDREYYALKL
ncbi:MAG: hypothetical protein IKS78_08570 [Clostridia bacterium]|nr:hypothetical protein [Clostridia bacterium]